MISRFAFLGDGGSSTPSNPKLILTVQVSGPTVQFAYTLTKPLTANLDISSIFADNYINCGGTAQGSLRRTSLFTITAGFSGSGTFSGTIFGTFNTTKSTIYNVYINTTNVNNGSTLTVGGATLEISLQQCS